jgi:serine-type D-Ala-D-Ala carboxypeptidase/endopeptidase (penicillin-binding protein 4)
MNLNLNCLDFYVAPTGPLPGQLTGFVTDPPTRYASVRNQCVSGADNAIDLTRQFGSNDVILRGSCRAKNEQPVSVTLHDPGLYAATVLAETLTAAGIHVSGPVARDLTVRASLARLGPADRGQWELVAVHETPIAQALARANKDSVNLYAECLCKRLAFAVTGASGSWKDGTAAVGAMLKEIGVPDAQYRLDDGCGLSKDNAISAHALVSVLTFDYLSPNRQTFLDSLSVAGADGTLEKRFEGTDLRGRVMGKSGYVDMVSTLSGFLRARDDNWYAFSILFNGIPGGGKPLQEAIVRAIDNSVRPRVAQAR